ncbi:Serine carboxypeptidase-like 49 [Camellia lanceoleosa]|uniref:Serine carboxypeptidase-like 49 n=1 Tax=Camellia lanceoleosa TaxID=1840588 RepID=A0ACC0FX08_9ERIC|nr:Serine carboxypeptidase-like 49 [Camellia lanceoleosa]
MPDGKRPRVETSVSSPIDGRNIQGLTMASKNSLVWSGNHPSFTPNYEASNLLYVDQPIGTGFSYSSDKRDIRHNEGVSNDLYDFLQDIAGTLATEEAEDSAQLAKLRSALESVDHKRRKVYILVQETTFLVLF